MNCAICSRKLPHGDLAEKLCQRELLKHYEKELLIAKAEIKKLENYNKLRDHHFD